MKKKKKKMEGVKDGLVVVVHHVQWTTYFDLSSLVDG